MVGPGLELVPCRLRRVPLFRGKPDHPSLFVGALRRTAGLQASICAYPRRVSPAHTGYAARLVTGLRPGHPRH